MSASVIAETCDLFQACNGRIKKSKTAVPAEIHHRCRRAAPGRTIVACIPSQRQSPVQQARTG